MDISRLSPPIDRTSSPKGQHFRQVFWYNLARMALLYFVPLLLLAVFFQLEYRRLLRESQRAHLEVIAEHQGKTFDLFLLERVVNLENLIDDPLFPGLDIGEPLLSSLLGGHPPPVGARSGSPSSKNIVFSLP